ncbi:hypothetical protein BF49_0784 [Bradyrhizobium sp.]|nr:hypothetical protein BF49_0784 [Bradyrhizobium sp.]
MAQPAAPAAGAGRRLMRDAAVRIPADFEPHVGMRSTIWLDGDRDEPITSGHSDGCLAVAADGTLLVEPIAHGQRRRERDIAVLQRWSRMEASCSCPAT